MNVLRKARTATAFGVCAALLATGGTVVAVAFGEAAAADPFTVSAQNGLNVRSGPGMTRSILGVLPGGSKIESIGPAEHGWMPIRWGDGTGWVSDTYLKSEGLGDRPATTAAVAAAAYTTADLNVRTGAGLSYRVVTVLPKGTKVGTTGVSSNGYTQIMYDGMLRWVSSRYLTQQSAAPSPAPSRPAPGNQGGRQASAGTATATAELMIRSTSGPVFDVITNVPAGTRLQLTGVIENGRTQVFWEGQRRWVNSLYLEGTSTVTKPVASTRPASLTTRYATADLILRSSSADNFVDQGLASSGTPLQVTGVVQNGRAQVYYNGAVRWVTEKYLSGQSNPDSYGGGNDDASVGTGGGHATVYGRAGLQPAALALISRVEGRWPQITEIGGVRQDPLPDHPSGHALDLMIPDYRSNGALGDTIAAWLKANASSFNIQYVIWNQHIWSVARSSEGWRYMADRGDDTTNHKDHVHITVN